jgi:uncharacterized OB-fold protein
MIHSDPPSFQALPVPDADTGQFWEGCAERRLLIQRCGSCGTDRFPPAPMCHRCRSWEHSWREHAGEGEVYSWVVVHHAIPPSIAPEVPYVSALIELDGGLHMPARLLEVDPGHVQAGMRVRVAFREAAPGVLLPVFVPARDAHDEGAGVREGGG